MPYYIKNEDLLQEIRASRAAGRPTEELGRQLLRIAKGVAGRANFRGYSFREDIEAAAVLKMIRYLPSFNEAKGTPFAWASRIAHNVALDEISKLRRVERLEDKVSALAPHHGYDCRPSVNGQPRPALTSAWFRPESARRRGLVRRGGRVFALEAA